MEEEFNFGTINQGDVVSHTFKFKTPVLSLWSSQMLKLLAGCTVPKNQTILCPGETGELVVEFNSAGKSMLRLSKLRFTANTNPPQSFIHRIRCKIEKLLQSAAAH